MNVFTKVSLLVLLTFCFSGVFAQNNIWADVSESSVITNDAKMKIVPDKYRTLSLDVNSFINSMKSAPKEFTTAAKINPIILSIPMPYGGVQNFKVVETEMMEPELAAKFPEIKTYSGQGIDDPYAIAKIDWSPQRGFHAMILSAVNGSVFVDPYTYGSNAFYISYYKKDLQVKPFIEEGLIIDPSSPESTNAGQCLGATLRRYRLAVACTGEYAVAVGATNATQLHAAIVTTINRVNGVYETEVSIRLVLVANNNLVEFLDPGTDPFNGNNNASTLIGESQTQIDTRIGSANYDIGHTFSTGGGGLAGLGVVCISGNKARGITGSANPVGDPYDIDYVAHEVGHQFGGNHTFNANSSCSNQGSTSSNSEPGSGSTIMAYAGICGSTQNLQGNSDSYFNAISFNQIGTFTVNSSGNSCATQIVTGNASPVVNAGPGYTIPRGTPFMLSGSATDTDGDSLTFCWEQINTGGTYGNWNSPSGNAPLFRSFNPTVSRSRIFPKILDIVNGTTTVGEFLPTYTRTLEFRLTARDNKAGAGAVCFGEVSVPVDGGAGPFIVTSQSAATTWTANGTNTATITWNVALTNFLVVPCTQVDFFFSVDGGMTYPYKILSATANDGSETITIPSVPTTKGRIMVKASNNIFFNINSANITIQSACASEGALVTPNNNVTATTGTGPLNLGLAPQYSTALTIAGQLASTDPATTSVANNTTPGCFSYSNPYRYDTYTFQPSTSGSYTFTFNGGANSMIANLYNGSYNPSSTCTNFLISSGTYTGSAISISSSLTQTLTAGNTYVLTIGTFNATSPALPANYSMNVTGGTIIGGSNVFINPGAGFSYAYVIVDNATGLIKEIKGNSDLTNTTTYPSGTFTVYGISYTTSQLSVLNSYVGQQYINLQNAILNTPNTLCANLSKNTVTATVHPTFPVTDLSLKARKSGSTVGLNWSTATEQNSAYYLVERSENGINFSQILDKVAAAGNSNTGRNYAITDTKPENSWNYYRIKQVDVDGKYTYSNIAAINFEKKGSSNLVLYPNPAKDQINIEFETARSGKVSLEIVDSKGAIVISQSIQSVTGKNLQRIPVSTLSTGVYILRTIDAEGNTSYTKFIKQ